MKKQNILIVFLLLVGQLSARSAKEWLDVQEKSGDAVVQILSEVVQFDWLQPYKKAEQSEASGSGFFINQNGDIATNAHVVDQAKKVWVYVPAFGKEKMPVDIIGVCPERDLAILRVTDEAKNIIATKFKSIPFLPLGDSDAVRRTDPVLGLGYPLGQFYLKSTTGIVSGPEFLNGNALIQITAPINAGNSGGPLLNTKGEVIGINSSVIESAENVGYGIPINELSLILDELLATPLVRKSMLGVGLNESIDEQARYLGNPVPGGTYIYQVYRDSIADTIGIKPGDMLYQLNDYRFDAHAQTDVPWRSDKASVGEIAGRFKLGEQIKALVYRNGERKELRFEWGQTPIYPIRQIYPDYEQVDHEILGGMVFMQLVDNHLPLLKQNVPYLIKYEKIENKTEPVLVITHIMPGSQAKRISTMQPGDIITHINGEPVKTLQEYSQALKKSKDSGYVTMRTVDSIFTVFPLADLLQDEERLSRDIIYSITPTTAWLMENVDRI